MGDTRTAQFSAETSDTGAFQRQRSRFRDHVTADGSSRYPAEPGRYHLYVAYACPWAHRAIIVRMLKGLDGVISMSGVDPIRDERGWRFGDGDGWFGPDPLEGFQYLSEAYGRSDPAFSGRVTVPVLWDRQSGCIVNNESADVVRMLNSAWDQWAENDGLDLYPSDLRAEIDELNQRVYDTVNNGVYKAGFATSQQAYDDAFHELFDTLDHLEDHLSPRRYLLGSRITEADWRLFTTLVRFDAVYVGHFRCNLRRVVDYPNLEGYLRELYGWPGIADTVNMDHIKRHYYCTHAKLNPTGILPRGPELRLDEPHGREHLEAAR